MNISSLFSIWCGCRTTIWLENIPAKGIVLFLPTSVGIWKSTYFLKINTCDWKVIYLMKININNCKSIYISRSNTNTNNWKSIYLLILVGMQNCTRWETLQRRAVDQFQSSKSSKVARTWTSKLPSLHHCKVHLWVL